MALKHRPAEAQIQNADVVLRFEPNRPVDCRNDGCVGASADVRSSQAMSGSCDCLTVCLKFAIETRTGGAAVCGRFDSLSSTAFGAEASDDLGERAERGIKVALDKRQVATAGALDLGKGEVSAFLVEANDVPEEDESRRPRAILRSRTRSSLNTG